MPAKAIHIDNEDQWRVLRKNNVGGSETAALFGVSPFTTKFELYHRKLGNLDDPEFGGLRILCGQELEPAIARIFSEIHGTKIRKVHRYLVDKDIRGMGGTMDFEWLTEDHGWVPLEIKNVDYLVFRDKWDTSQEERVKHDQILQSVEPPPYISLQLQQQIHLTGKNFGLIGCLVGGNEPYLVRQDRHVGAIHKICTAIEAFWNDVDNKREPDLVGADFDTVKKLYPNAVQNVPPVDMSDNERLVELLTKLPALTSIRKVHEEEEKAAKAEIANILGENSHIITPKFAVKFPVVTVKPFQNKGSTSRRMFVSKIQEKKKT